MRQAVLIGPEHIEFREVPSPEANDLGAHQVLAKIKRIGICGSEIHSWHGNHPATFYPREFDTLKSKIFDRVRSELFFLSNLFSIFVMLL